jgi:putative membrane protein
MYYDHGMGWWGFAGMGVGVVLFCAVVLAVVVAAVLASSDSSTHSPPNVGSPSPQSILDARFARGEIDVTEYRERTVAMQKGNDTRRDEQRAR